MVHGQQRAGNCVDDEHVAPLELDSLLGEPGLRDDAQRRSAPGQLADAASPQHERGMWPASRTFTVPGAAPTSR